MDFSAEENMFFDVVEIARVGGFEISAISYRDEQSQSQRFGEMGICGSLGNLKKVEETSNLGDDDIGSFRKDVDVRGHPMAGRLCHATMMSTSTLKICPG